VNVAQIRRAKSTAQVEFMSKQPNIVFIIADDHAAKAISCYGAGINQTPHHDRIAEEGMRFDPTERQTPSFTAGS
jgi:hypothetical protein